MNEGQMKLVLRIAGIYNILWGTVVIAFPDLFFILVGMEQPLYPMIWQCVGMIVGVYGVGYWFAANAPMIHWPITLVGFLGKILGPIGFAWYLTKGSFPIEFGMLIIFNDVIWWLPFGAILYKAFLESRKEMNYA